jgi:hypothetical protein
VDRQQRIQTVILGVSCALAWSGNALYALGSPGGTLKQFSPAIVVLGSVMFFGWHCNRRYGGKLTLLFVFSIFAIGWIFETLGVLTSVPFGQYQYTEIMAPFIGHVPVFVLPAYLFMGYAAWSMATLFLGVWRSRLSPEQARKIPPLAAFLMLLWDISMDPLRATIEGRWIWIDGGAYLGVPLSNFVGWFLVTWCMFSLFAYFIRRFPPDDALWPEAAKSFWVAIPIMYACYAGEYLLNPFTGHGLNMHVVGQTQYAVQHIYSIVAALTALTVGPALIFGFWIVLRQPAPIGPHLALRSSDQCVASVRQ